MSYLDTSFGEILAQDTSAGITRFRGVFQRLIDAPAENPPSREIAGLQS